ncbi:MAG TPA: hypothetical protein VGO03_03080 [Acidimicrobiia bacterium]|jgi:hypothetical protein
MAGRFGFNRAQFWTSKAAGLMVLVLTSAAVFAATSPPTVAGAISSPFVQNQVTTDQNVDMICRANGGALGGNEEEDQTLNDFVTAPDVVQPGETYTIKIHPRLSIFPASSAAPIGTATVNYVYDNVSSYTLPASLHVNSVSMAPSDGNIAANPDAGYFVAKANVPASAWADPPTPFDPTTQLPAADLVAIPGTTPSVLLDTSTNTVRYGLLGNSGSKIFPGGSAVQAPAITISVTAPTNVAAGTALSMVYAGTPPGGNFTGSQAGNFTEPSTFSVNTSTLQSSDTTWINPSFLTIVNATDILTVTAYTACAPGYESNTDLGTTPPSYYTGPNAIPNGTSPPLATSVITGIASPIDGGSYSQGQTVLADYSCQGMPNYDGNPADCVGDVPEGSAIDTSTPGTFTFNVSDGTESTSDSYTVTGSNAPTANAGPDQTGKTAGTVVTLDGSGSTDTNSGTPTYTWTQTAGPAVTLSNSHAVKPTFTVAGVTSPSGDTYTFQLTVSDGPTLQSSDSVNVTSTPSTPTVAVTKSRSGGTCSNFCIGDVVTLTAGITNPDGNSPGDYTYAWTQTGGRTTSLSSNTAANPTFILPPNGTNNTGACTSGTGAVSPTSANCPTYSVVVTKTSTAKSSATAALAAYASTLATRPVANAGTAQTRGPNRTVTLDGSASTQANGHPITYAWTQTGGTTVALSSTSAQKPTFTTPAGAGTLTFSLIVTDTQNAVTGNGTNGNTSTAATTTVNISADGVVADAGPDQTAKLAGNTITLTAAASTDPDGLPLSYTWQQLTGPTVTLSNPNVVSPTFTAPAATTSTGYSMTFTVTATNGNPGANNTNTDATPVTISVVPSTPTVAVTKSRTSNGGTCTNFCTGDVVTLNAGITNPDGNTPTDYTYAWTQTGGRTTSLSSNTAQNPTYILPPSGSGSQNTACTSGTGAVSTTSANCPTFSVIVTKTNTAKSSTNTALAAYASTLATRPVANAGSTQTPKVGTTVTLDGSASSQTNGHPVSYAWSQTAGPTVSLSSTTAQKPTFTAPNSATTLTFSLVVTDTQNAVTGSGTNGNTSTASTVNINAADYAAPLASAGSNQTVRTSKPVTLDASGSSQADGHTLTYQWTQTGGTTVTLSDPTAVKPTFTSPNASSTLKFTVTVTDTQNPNPATNSSTSNAVTVAVNDDSSPSADAGVNQVVHVVDPVTLDGSNSSQADADPLTYQWTQLSGTTVTLSNPTAVKPTFTAPHAASTLQFELTVTDPLNPNPALRSASAFTEVDVHDYPAPTANAGPDQSGINPNKPVQLDGSASTSNSPHAITYQWTQTAGPTVTLSNPTAAKPTFTSPTGPLTLTFKLVVNDSFFDSAASFVNVDVNGIGGLDFAGHLTGTVTAQKAKSSFVFTVVNNGVLSRTVNSNDFALSITVNGHAVAASQYAITSRSATVAADHKVQFALTWNHGSSLNAGDVIVVKACENMLGDVLPANNCGVINDPPGPINIFAWPHSAPTPFKVRSVASKSTLPIWVTNLSSFTVSPLTPGTNITVSVSVNGGPAQTATPASAARFALSPAKDGTVAENYVWNHAAIAKNSSVKVTACAVVPGNAWTTPCYSYTVLSI